MTSIPFTLPGRKHRASATPATPKAEADLRIAQGQGLGTASAMQPKPASRADLLTMCSSALHFDSATI
ncbi:hypothetical protein [Bradyrhizobium sp. 199]|uniref:hypothetical protein n=1 Tax=Bradyrhizobium sp. 199 TaxID=2782664 RepID=UPI001FFA0FBD|nr:hypothetical protein [Bradyrhizobium sp. 199]MCK1359646.1 hypothetical protein [Bradyrhizobium sp. 199]